ncbi:MAG: hypothetical protein RIT27_1193 [Pseudomonadota bacterium]|jgi:hypothetical protein
MKKLMVAVVLGISSSLSYAAETSVLVNCADPDIADYNFDACPDGTASQAVSVDCSDPYIILYNPDACPNSRVPYCDEPNVAEGDWCLDPLDRIDSPISDTPEQYDPTHPIDFDNTNLISEYIDGVYQCYMTAAPATNSANSTTTDHFQAYATLTSRKDGTTDFVLASEDMTKNPFYGYGTGKFSFDTLIYQGITSEKKTFAFNYVFNDLNNDDYIDEILAHGNMEVVLKSDKSTPTTQTYQIDCTYLSW